MTVRAFFDAIKIDTAVAPYDTMTLKLFYPAKLGDTAEERNTGVVPAAAELAPFPVVVFMPGINCGTEAYQWLAVEIAQRGFVVVLFTWIAEEMPGYISLTPGVDLEALKAGKYGSKPTSPALPAIFAALEKFQHSGRLAGLLDLERIILGGHSAGGTMALQNVNNSWFPQVVAGFAYGGHTAASTFLGYEAGTILPIDSKRPLLIIGGTQDGVIASSSGRYGAESDPTLPVKRTFHEAVTGGQNHAYLLFLEGANHFSLAYPKDETTGRPFIDWPETVAGETLRHFLGEVIVEFVVGYGRGATTALTTLHKKLDARNPLIAAVERK